MSQGIIVNGDGNKLLFSTETDNLSFQGKATYVAHSGLNVDYRTYSATVGVVFNWPTANLYAYDIALAAQIDTILPFVYNPIGKRVGILTTYKLDSTTWRIVILACTNPSDTGPANDPLTYLPTVYVFANHISANVHTGYGINVFNQNSKPVFSTNSRPLLIRRMYSGGMPYSNLTVINENFFDPFYIGNSDNRFLKSRFGFAPFEVNSAIAKPAICFCGTQTAVGSAFFLYLYFATAYFVPASNNLVLEWAYGGASDNPAVPIQQSTPGLPFFAQVIDAAQYD